MKKGQIMGQPFIFILALIVGALVLIFGVTQIGNIGNFGCKAQITREIQGLETEVQKMFYEFSGSSGAYSMDIPKAEYICFTTPGDPLTLPQSELNQIEPNLASIIPVNTKYNLFLVPLNPQALCKIDTTRFTIPNLNISKDINPVCVKPNQKFRLTSKGEYVELSNPQ